MAMLARLLLYSTLLSPGFILMGLFYFFSNRVHRNIWYGRMVRHWSCFLPLVSSVQSSLVLVRLRTGKRQQHVQCR
jgi:hypothetical protein